MPRKLMIKINLGALLLELSKAEPDIEKAAAMLEECAKISTEALQLQAMKNILLHTARKSHVVDLLECQVGGNAHLFSSRNCHSMIPAQPSNSDAAANRAAALRGLPGGKVRNFTGMLRALNKCRSCGARDRT